jgi:hypothetical protein
VASIGDSSLSDEAKEEIKDMKEMDADLGAVEELLLRKEAQKKEKLSDVQAHGVLKRMEVRKKEKLSDVQAYGVLKRMEVRR